jgi:hypothetical protein
MAFLAAFFMAVALTAAGIPTLLLPLVLASEYTPYPESPVVIYSPLAIAPAALVGTFFLRRAKATSWAAQGLFFGTVVGVLLLGALVILTVVE